MDLRTKFAVLLVVITLVLSLATYGGLEIYKRQQVERTRADVAETADLAAGQIEARLNGRADYVAFIAQRADGRPSDGPLLAEMLDNSRFFAARVVADNGTVVALRGPYPDERRRELLGRNATGADCVRRTLSVGDICITPPTATDERGTHVVGIVAPIFERNRTVGALEAAIRLNEATLFGPIEPLDRDAQTVVVRHDRTVLYPRRVPDATAESAIVGTATVGSTEWVVEVRRDRAALNAQLRSIAVAQAAGIFLLALGAVLVGYWEYRVNLRQTRRLLDAFRALERGEYDRSLSLSAAREWEQISAGFNGLAATLESREEALRAREQRLDVLNRLIRHNLRNEMTVILGHAELLASETEEGSEAADSIASILDAGDRLLALGKKVRRMGTGLPPDESPRPVDAVPLIRRAVAAVRDDHPEARIGLSLPDSLPVLGHPSLRDAVRELVENACEHTDEAVPHVTVDATDEGDEAVIRVTDDGPDIPAVERRTMDLGHETPVRHGSGVGLWLVRWIVDWCGGSLGFDQDPAQDPDRDGGRSSVVIRLRTPTGEPGTDDEQ